MRKAFRVFAAVLFLSLFKGLCLFAGEVDILVNKLAEKGILTPAEAQNILAETKKEAAEEAEKKKSNSLLAYIANLKLKGDLRLRYQWNKKKASAERHRGRYRLRLGLETKVSSKALAGFGLATGGSDPRSTNQTMGNTFETPDIRLDYAFAEYFAAPWLKLYGGKFKRKAVLWQPCDLLWDSDINPEGAAAVINKKLNSRFELFFNTGVFVLDESSGSTSDPVMYAAQPGFVYKAAAKASLKSALAYYGFSGLKGASLDHSSGTNTLDSSGHLVYNYNSINPSVELEFKNLQGLIPSFALFGEYVYNWEASGGRQGYLGGVRFGAKKIEKKGQWQFKYMYRCLEKDAWPDAFPDSDFYGGATGVKGHEAAFQYGLARQVVFGLDYYYSENIKGVKKPENLLQVDLTLKF